MKFNFLLVFSFVFFSTSAQNFTGQWKGEFTDKSTSFSGFGGDQCDYVLELECTGDKVTGSSYTYFSDGGKKYYTICKLVGTINSKQRSIEVKEIERTKTNVPINIRNCFQVHKLTYFKKGDSTILEGDWIPAPEQQGDCGFGITYLSRRELKKNYPAFNSTASKSVTKKPVATNKKATTSKAVVKAKTATPKNTIAAKPKTTPQNNTAAAKTKKDFDKKELPDTAEASELVKKETPDSILVPKIKFEKRSNTVLQTISVKNKTVKVDLYDNGEVDGDSISLFYNGKLLMSSKRLSEKPITLTITVEDDIVNELVMYAENLGIIPPNTALMVVTDGPKRYEVRITSDLQKSGVINFVHKSGS